LRSLLSLYRRCLFRRPEIAGLRFDPHQDS
jgi:hypothetical protein